MDDVGRGTGADKPGAGDESHEPRPFPIAAVGRLRILVAGADRPTIEFVERGLRGAGYATFVARDGEDALLLGDSDAFDLLILDLSLPSLDGLEVLGELRARGRGLPIIIVAAQERASDLVDALERGADDTIMRPFRFRELLARVRARLRDAEVTVLTVGDARLDVRTRRVAVGPGLPTVGLTAEELALASTFFQHPGDVLTREQLLERGWAELSQPSEGIVDLHVASLQRKLDPLRISSVPGVGYRLELPDEPEPGDAA